MDFYRNIHVGKIFAFYLVKKYSSSFFVVRFTDDQMNDEIDRIRKENGWKPRKRGKPGRRGRGSGSSNGGETPNNTAAADEHVKLLQKLQVGAKNISSGSSNGGEAPNNTAAADEHVNLLQKLQIFLR